MSRRITIGTRGSDLALWQANTVKRQLEELGHAVVLEIIKTRGDAIQHLSFDKIEGKGFFTKELEDALLEQRVDLAVHSHKDLETTQPDGLCIAAVSPRENPSDILIMHKDAVDFRLKFQLKTGAKVGTSSARRKNQLIDFRPDLELADIRGNVPTRLDKLRKGEFDAILLAKAGINRLNLDISDLECFEMDIKEFIPAPAQGVLALQIRSADRELFEALQPLNAPNVATCVGIEREILRRFNGGCQLPLGAYCEKAGSGYRVWTSVAESWDTAPKRINKFGESPETLAAEVVAAIKKKSTVLITSQLKDKETLVNLCSQQGIELHGQSFLEVTFNPFKIPAQSPTWIFFSSKNSVKSFFLQCGLPEGCKIGALGTSTAYAVEQFGYPVDYTGTSGDTSQIGEEFNALLGPNDYVWLPISSISNQSIQQMINRAPFENILSYDSVPAPVEVGRYDVILFTSPSNVKGYFLLNSIPRGTRVLAMGELTQSELAKKSIEAAKVVGFSQVELHQSIAAILS
ncbi:MAG TPA: hydroxymethylbilane synthase [Luteibaculaceae bacterium]|nr:hydroxymethylbilane synthase [Luteibaculaceae bacterium]